MSIVSYINIVRISFQPDWDYEELYLPVSQYPSLPGVEIFIDSSGYVSDNITFFSKYFVSLFGICLNCIIDTLHWQGIVRFLISQGDSRHKRLEKASIHDKYWYSNLVSEQMVVETDFLLSVSYDGVSKAEVKVPEDYKGL